MAYADCSPFPPLVRKKKKNRVLLVCITAYELLHALVSFCSFCDDALVYCSTQAFIGSLVIELFIGSVPVGVLVSVGAAT